MLKKMTLLAMAVGALIAFAAPAAAQANNTTFNGGTEVFEGWLEFHRPAVVGEAPTGSFGCPVTVKVTGVNGTNDASVTEFNPTTTSCEGTGLFAGCHLISDSANVPFTATANTTDLNVTKPEGDITVLNAYTGCAFGIPGSHLEFASITAEPTLTPNGGIETLAISGTATAGGLSTAGTLHAEEDPETGEPNHALTLN